MSKWRLVPPSEDRLGYYRERAKTIREAAESVRDPDSKQTLLRPAQAYEEMVAGWNEVKHLHRWTEGRGHQ
jgi:hypothetical protein